jgi:hypothetical protein
MYKIILTLLLPTILISCQESQKEMPKSDYDVRREKEKKLDTLNLKQAFNLTVKNNAILGWDSVANFTYRLQEMFENTNRPIAFLGEIEDIVKKDSLYLLKIVSSNFFKLFKTYNAEVLVSRANFETLEKTINIKKSTKGCFIFYVSGITSSSPILDSKVESSSETLEDATSYITYDFEETLIKIYGNLKDYIIDDQLPDEGE